MSQELHEEESTYGVTTYKIIGQKYCATIGENNCARSAENPCKTFIIKVKKN